MKLTFVSVLIALNLKVTVLSHRAKSIALQEALAGIVQSLMNRSHMLTIIKSENASMIAEIAIASATAGVPHVVEKIVRLRKKIILNSSAIVAVESVGSLVRINQITFYEPSFSMSQQVIVYCENGTFDDMSKLLISKESEVSQF